MLYMGSTVHAVGLGLYARRRHNFRSDFTYNKFHFGVFVQLASAVGLAACSKLASPLVPSGLLLAAIAMVSIPAYKEGFREIRNMPDDIPYDEKGYMRRAGIYALMAAYAMLFYKRRGSIPFFPPPTIKK